MYVCFLGWRRADERDRMYERDQIAREIRELESTRSNKLKRFGDYMPHLLQTINDAVRQGVFHQPPKGPLGACCTYNSHACNICLINLLLSSSFPLMIDL